MALAYRLCTSPYSPLKVFARTPRSKTSLHATHVSLTDPDPQVTEHSNSPEDSEFKDPDAKSSSLSKRNIWVNPRRSRPKQLLTKSYDVRSSLLNVVKSLVSCNPSEQHVSEILKGLGDKVLVRDAVFILNNMVNPETALLALQYFLHKIKPTGHVVLYNVTLKLFRKIKDFERAEKLFDEMLQSGVKPNMITFTTIISCAAMCSFPHKAVEWFEKMPSFGIEPDENLSSAMICICTYW